ncbi:MULTISPECIES: hypothetical protein [Comamonas]|jgi:hypothetical protein|uniref:Transmembrane protein n=1 Tax=Comamonas avium TaxID=2762231 RepID=A0ABR8S638_9BURK|nr:MULTISPECIES: hypothetical protein [Comamonas]MBD7958952.1 hypothetical protein [Comamonas avium]MBD9403276.1 hypothetical protein [Comamonas sp. CMM02]
MLAQRWMWIAWPAFLAAGVMEMLVFSVFDPMDMSWWGQSVELSRSAVYTIAFFIFWAVFSVAGYLTMLLSIPAAKVNGEPSIS